MPISERSAQLVASAFLIAAAEATLARSAAHGWWVLPLVAIAGAVSILTPPPVRVSRDKEPRRELAWIRLALSFPVQIRITTGALAWVGVMTVMGVHSGLVLLWLVALVLAEAMLLLALGLKPEYVSWAVVAAHLFWFLTLLAGLVSLLASHASLLALGVFCLGAFFAALGNRPLPPPAPVPAAELPEAKPRRQRAKPAATA